jgi:trehalose 6-phosphate phosphatase
VARELVVALAAARPPLLVVSDFDGTLAEISSDPMGSRIEPLARVVLRRLARLANDRPDRLRVAILSGRTAPDVASRVRVGGVAYLGNHGLEIGRLRRGRRAERLATGVDARLRPFADPARRFADAVADRLHRPDWLFIEDKGPSVTFHYREAADPAAAAAAIDRATAGGLVPPGFVRLDGRRMVEFRPAGHGGKGAAMARLIRRHRPGAVLVLGDDRSDAEAFTVVSAARARRRAPIAGLSVAVHGAHETPAEVLAAADVLLASPRDAARLLSALATHLAAELGREEASPAPVRRP